MKTKKLTYKNAKKTLTLLSASKMLVASNTAFAAGGKGDEMAPTEAELAPQLSLHQSMLPFDGFIPPFNDDDFSPDGSMFEDEYGMYDNTGVLFVGEMEGQARMDFVINGIRNDQPMDIYLVMGTELAPFDENDPFPGLEPLSDQEMNMGGTGMMGPKPMGGAMPRQGERESLEQQIDALFAELEQLEASGAPMDQIDSKNKEIKQMGNQVMKSGEVGKYGVAWKPRPGRGQMSPPVRAGEICVDLEPENLEVIAAVRIHPREALLPPQPTKVGTAIPPHFNSTILSVKLADLKQFEGQEVFFQAAAVPTNPPESGNPLDETQVSECDRYIIEHVEEEMGEEGNGGKYDSDDPEDFMPQEPPTETGTETGTDTGSKN